MRGEGRKLKVVESAKKAVLQGVASSTDIQVAVNGADVDASGKIVPAGMKNRIAGVNGVDCAVAAGSDGGGGGHISLEDGRSEQLNAHDEADNHTPQVKDRMDIALHNFGDYS